MMFMLLFHGTIKKKALEDVVEIMKFTDTNSNLKLSLCISFIMQIQLYLCECKLVGF